MSSLNALRGFTTKQVYSVPERGTELGWVELEHSHQLQIVNVLAEYYRTYQDAGPDGSSFMQNLKNQLGPIKVRDWMFNEDVALLARAPTTSTQWAKIQKITQNQENQYKSWMAKETTDFAAWSQEFEENSGPHYYFYFYFYFYF